MTCILAVDQGTTSSRAILFDGDLQPVGTAQREFDQHFPRPGWVEHDPEEIWRSVLDTAKHALAAARVGAVDVAALGITNQRETTVVWERSSGEPLHPVHRVIDLPVNYHGRRFDPDQLPQRLQGVSSSR